MRKFFFTLLIICFCQWVSAQDTILLTTGRKIIVSSIDLSDNTIAYRKIDKKDKLKTIEPYRVFSILYKDGTERIIYQPDSLDPLDFKVEDMRNYIKGMQDAQSLYKNNYIKITGAVIGAGSALLGFYGLVGPPLYATVVGSYSPNVDKKLQVKIYGDASGTLGIKEGSYLNNITGEISKPLIKKDQKLQLGGKTLKFRDDTNLDSAIATINSKFNCIRIHAANENGKIKLFKTDRPDLINVNEYREGFEKKVRDYKIRNGMIYGLAGLLVGSITYIAINASND
jgi:hypothetical protein